VCLTAVISYSALIASAHLLLTAHPSRNNNNQIVNHSNQYINQSAY
jgi:hypothetical protein